MVQRDEKILGGAATPLLAAPMKI